MIIRVVGPGCSKCKSLHERIKKLVEEGKIEAEVEYSTDMNELISNGVLGSPAIFKNGKVRYVGSPTDEETLIKVLKA